MQVARRRRIGCALAAMTVATTLVVGTTGGPAGAACTTGPPANDSLSGNTPLQLGVPSIGGDQVCATAETGEFAHGGDAASASLWYRFRLEGPVPTQIQLWTVGSQSDTQLAAYVGASTPCFCNMVLLGSNDDYASPQRWSQVTVNVPGSSTAYIAVDRYGAAVEGSTGTVMRWRYSYAPFEAPGRYVDRIFADFLGRAATTAEKGDFVGRLDRQPVEEVAAAIIARGQPNTYHYPIARLYRSYFDRRTDGAGLRYWIGEMKKGKSLSSVSAAFAASSEFKTKYGPLSNLAFVDLVYQNVLGRNASDADRTYWTGQLANGYSRSKLMLQFSESAENRNASDRRFRTDVVAALTGTSLATPARNVGPTDDGAIALAFNTILVSQQYGP